MFGDIELEKIEDIQDGDKIYWLDTFVHDYEVRMNALKKKVAEFDVEINLLIMSHENGNAPFRGKAAYPSRPVESYIYKLKALENDLFFDLKEINSNKKKRGSIQAKLYRFTPHFPIFIIDRTSTKHEEAYSGFYLNNLPQENPYLRWVSSSEDPFYIKLIEYFGEKWADEENTVPQEYELDNSRED